MTIRDSRSSKNGNGVFTQKPMFSAAKYIEIFKNADGANMPNTINLAMTPDVTTELPFFNPECIAIMEQVRKAVKEY
ncbi:hypothetical protein [Cellulophaga sp. L1A9]|uniref:hypothetical protein n=1 Tax=Cellulophaga sp. L1A9 TaxID=2686362 RepID=UPI00131B8CE6|nr:hypothetical protein [Cellulophaga sp. L1A9]